MSIKAGIYGYLSSHAVVTAEIGARLYPGVAPAGAGTPRVTYSRISGMPHPHQDGGANITASRFQFDCWGATSVEAEDTAEALRMAMDGYRGVMGDVEVRLIHLASRRDDYFEPTNDSESGTHRVSMDFEIWHVEPVPTLA